MFLFRKTFKILNHVEFVCSFSAFVELSLRRFSNTGDFESNHIANFIVFAIPTPFPQLYSHIFDVGHNVSMPQTFRFRLLVSS